MAERVVIGQCEIWHGDALDVLRAMDAGSVDAVVMDPPYCSGGFTESGKGQAASQGLRSETIRNGVAWFGSDNMTAGGLIWLLRSVANECARVMRPTGSMLIFCDWRMVPQIVPAVESVGLRYRNLIAWKKPAPGLGNGFRPQHEMVIHLAGAKAKYHDAATGNVIECGRQHHSSREHPTQKPVDLMRRLIRVVAPVGGVVLDPFAGSGTTGVAALQEGRRFIGVEREPEHAETARRRIQEANSADDTPLFAGAAE